jgi:putative flippase GtrA
MLALRKAMSAQRMVRRLWSRIDVVARSAGVGVLATLVDLLLLGLLVSALGIAPRLASVPALAAGVAVQFVGNKLFAFRDPSRRWVRQAGQFAGVETIAFAANLVAFDLAVTHLPLPYLVLRVLTTASVYFCICLPLWSRIFQVPELEAS